MSLAQQGIHTRKKKDGKKRNLLHRLTMKGIVVNMKKSSWIFFLSFLVGIVGMNLCYAKAVMPYDMGITGNISILSGQMSKERYFCHVFLLRSRLWVALMLLEKALPEGIVVYGCGSILSAMFGGLATIAVTTGGIKGIFLLLLSLFPHWIFYGIVFYLWQRKRLSVEREKGYSYRTKEQLAEHVSGSFYWWIVFIIFLGGILCEGFIQPFFLEKVINL